MNFRTEVGHTKYNFNIEYDDPICLMGSCFSDHIGKKLLRSKFEVLSNPLGITFNPISLIRQLEYVLDFEELDIDDLAFRDGLWHHFDFHGKYSGKDKQNVYEQLIKELKKTADYIKKCKVVFITMGTANVFRYIPNNKIVANNHKFALDQFQKTRLTVREIVSRYEQILDKLFKINPALKIVFTVSPVRYTRDGLIENQRSKATLLLSIDDLVNFDNVHYFPSFELFVDELRDYRFYNQDMIHPNESGIDFIWEKFCESFFDEETQIITNEVIKLVRSTEHRPIHPSSELHFKFLKKLRDQIQQFRQAHADMDFSRELDSINKQLSSF